MMNDKNNLIKKAMDPDRMGLEEPSPDLVRFAREKVMARKKAPEKKSRFFDLLFVFLNRQLKLYQVGFSVLVTGVCLFYSIEINVESRNSSGFINDNPNTLSIKNTTLTVNSSTLLTSIPTLRN